MKTIALRLEGPLQSWGTQSKHGVRLAGTEPSKSGVIGLVGAALGMARDDGELLAELAGLELAVRVDRPGSILRDYHTAGGGTFRGDPSYTVAGNKNPVTSQRYYLQDASFVALLSGADDLVERISSAVQDPRWPLFLGRRSCVTSERVFYGVHDAAPFELLESVPRCSRSTGRLRALIECEPGEGDPRSDVPASFKSTNRHHLRRYVKTHWVTPPGEAS